MANDDRLSKSVTLIKDLRPGMKNVTCVFLVIDKGTVSHTKDGSVVRKCRVADKSASICFSLWNEQAAAIEGGDILKLTKGYASLWKGSMVLYSGKYGKLEKIGEFSMLYSETPDMSDSSQDFAQRGQPPPQNPPNGGPVGGRPPAESPRGGGGGGSLPNNSGSGGRMGNGPSSVSGNWNGNNHLGDSRLPPNEAPPTSLVGHMTYHDSTSHHHHNGGSGIYPPYHHQQKQPLMGHPEDTSSSSSNYRGPLKPPHPSNERYHPYHRPPLANHAPDPRLGWR